MVVTSLVYRDIKKENIGFDVRGDAKIFDFGLSKCLSQDLKARDPVSGQEVYGYKLTPRTGSICTMAPEVASGHPYDEKCDVFSFAILLWEILALEERPWVHIKWPAVTKKLLRQAWEGDPERRPDMRKVSAMLRADLNALTEAPEVKDRTVHMLNRSTHSFCMEPREVNLDREGDMARAWHEDDMSCEES
jgi:serine/threonine protein kinase